MFRERGEERIESDEFRGILDYLHSLAASLDPVFLSL